MKRFNKDEAEKEKIFFNDIFEDITKFCKKINQVEYLVKGEFPIIDQGKNKIAGFSYLKNEVYRDTPVIIFGDHTRVIKFIDFPFLIGADGVKVLKNRREEFLDKYLYYALKYFKIPNTGYNRHFKWLKEFYIYSSNIETQKKIVKILDIIQELIEIKNKKLKELDNLSKCLFIKMFGNIILNDKNWKIQYWKNVLEIKNGKNQRKVENKNGKYPIYGSGGIIGFADDYLCKENSVIIGRKGNINKPIIVFEKFWNVDTAFGLEPNDEILSVYYLYYFCREYNFEIHNKAVTIPSLVKGDLEKIKIPIPPIELQNKFAERIKLIEKSKFEIQNSIDETQKLFDSLMDKYFG